MSTSFPDDALLPPTGEVDTRPARLKLAAFVPIAIALAGVGAILLGGLSAHYPAMSADEAGAIDPVITGSVQPVSFDKMTPDDQCHALEMLDR